jgi:hypothetical protein
MASLSVFSLSLDNLLVLFTGFMALYVVDFPVIKSYFFVFLDTAFCQNQSDHKWYLFDDNCVSEIKEQAVVVSARTFFLVELSLYYNFFAALLL